ncbi:hypothetical protein PHLGIDRAFT_80620 [Phlebiopsis gigantea 11061_1 CR5-6]|uniref:FAD/NAD(P)-binding domain-containing protein n=1 Tax=Phlebiopsis gigantea (strain 11061_1 CR5-6) TaxID=745531 RepID=A0A0C3NA96_PHLG1|nr:hypothetical protein PHLGIDRAFT_80620 [Phlebiopsis gigantea 11061_1 CR5-6]
MSYKKSDASKKNVVVVGGGYANVHVVNYLEKTLDRARFNLVLVNPRPYYVHLIASLRVAVTAEGHLEDEALIPYDKLPAVTLVQGKVTAIEEAAPGKGGVLVLEGGERVEYVALVLGTGSTWTGTTDFPDTDADIREHLRSWRAAFSKAKNVVIVGGGAVGIELSGEILDAYPRTKVTIVHGGEHLLNDTYPDRFRKNIEDRVRKRGVAVVDEDYIDNFPEPNTTADVTTRRGKVLKSVDLVVPAFGARPNTTFINSLGAGVLTEEGFVKVKPTLELPAHPGVFAVGDILDWKEQKQAGKVMGHAAAVAANLVSFLDGRPQTKVYKGSPEMIVVPIGKAHGAGYLGFLWGITLGSWFTSLVKGKTLLLPMAKGKLHYA